MTFFFTCWDRESLKDTGLTHARKGRTSYKKELHLKAKAAKDTNARTTITYKFTNMLFDDDGIRSFLRLPLLVDRTVYYNSMFLDKYTNIAITIKYPPLPYY